MSMSKLISEVVLAGSSIFCIHRIGAMKTHSFLAVANIIQFFEAFLGIIKHGLDKEAAGEPHYNEYQLTVIFSLPLVAAQLHAHYDSPIPLVLSHVFLSYIPFVNDDYKRNDEQHIAEGIMGLNVISLATISALNKNYFGLGAAGLFSLGYFLVGTSIEEEYQGYRCKELFHYFLAILNILASEAVIH